MRYECSRVQREGAISSPDVTQKPGQIESHIGQLLVYLVRRALFACPVKVPSKVVSAASTWLAVVASLTDVITKTRRYEHGNSQRHTYTNESFAESYPVLLAY